MSHPPPLRGFLAPKLRQVAQFFASQGITMAGNLLYGFLCVRLLPISDYAKFAVVFGFLGTFTVLMDVGTCSTLLPLIGERIDDLQLIADYIASLRQLAHWLFLLVAPLLIVFYPMMVRNQGWNGRVVTAMVVILLVATWCSRVCGAYGAALIVRRDRKFWYRAQMISSYGTLALLGVVWATHALTAFSAILINLAGMVYVSLAYFFRSRSLLGNIGRPSAEKRKAILHLALPIIPNSIFYALQGQISLFLITIFGLTASVAGVGALSRLGQIFVLFAQMNGLLIEPYFAKLPRQRLMRNYLGMLAVSGAFALSMAGTAYFFPQIFLWILGHKYSGLRFEVFLALSVNAIAYFYGVVCVINAARRFIYWWNGVATIILVLAVQVFFIWRTDLSTIRGVLTMGMATAGAVLLVNAYTGAHGFIWGARETPTLVAAAESETYVQS